MKKTLVLLAALTLLILSGCTPTAEESSAPVSDPPSERVSGENSSPSLSDESSTNRLVPVEKLPLYDDISPGEDERISILDIDGSKILLAMQDAYSTRTDHILIYDMDTREVTSQEDISGVYVFYGQFIESDYVYSAVDTGDAGTEDNLIRDMGYVRRVGTHEWEYTIDHVVADGDALPMPFALDNGDVAFIDCGGVYYRNKRTFMEHMKVVIIAPDGSSKVLFTPETDSFMAYSHLMPYEDGFMFRLRTDNGYEIYFGNQDTVEHMITISNCRSIFPWWILNDGRFLFLFGYGNDEEGLTSLESVLMTDQGIVLSTDKTPYSRLTSDDNGKIAAVDSSWKQYVLQIKNASIEAARIDLPAQSTEFYYDGAGTLYAHLDTPTSNEKGLYKIVV